jgi:hypothetical protein
MKCNRHTEHHVAVYLNEEKFHEVGEIASDLGISVSGFIRMCLNEKLKTIADERRNMSVFSKELLNR